MIYFGYVRFLQILGFVCFRFETNLMIFFPYSNSGGLFHVLVTTSCSKASSFHVFCGFVGVDPVARERVSLLRKVPRGPHEGIANTVLNKRRITIDRRGNRVLRPHCFVTPERSFETTTTTTSYPRLRIGKSRNKIELNDWNWIYVFCWLVKF